MRDAAIRIRVALRELDLHDSDVVVIVSPHGRAEGVYRAPAGSLDELGAGGPEVSIPTDPRLARELAAAWDRPLLEEPCDHGIVVPLLLGFLPEVPVVAVTLPDGTSDPSVEDLAAALESVAGNRDLALVCSAHTSATLSARSPVLLTEDERNQAIEDETDLLEALGDPGRDARAALRRMSRAHSCSVATLELFTMLIRDGSAELLAYEKPVGVGYVVACT